MKCSYWVSRPGEQRSWWDFWRSLEGCKRSDPGWMQFQLFQVPGKYFSSCQSCTGASETGRSWEAFRPPLMWANGCSRKAFSLPTGPRRGEGVQGCDLIRDLGRLWGMTDATVQRRGVLPWNLNLEGTNCGGKFGKTRHQCMDTSCMYVPDSTKLSGPRGSSKRRGLPRDCHGLLFLFGPLLSTQRSIVPLLHSLLPPPTSSLSPNARRWKSDPAKTRSRR